MNNITEYLADIENVHDIKNVSTDDIELVKNLSKNSSNILHMNTRSLKKILMRY